MASLEHEKDIQRRFKNKHKGMTHENKLLVDVLILTLRSKTVSTRKNWCVFISSLR